jgi:hypothetical protein
LLSHIIRILRSNLAGWCSGDAVDLYLRGTRFEPLTGHRLSYLGWGGLRECPLSLKEILGHIIPWSFLNKSFPINQWFAVRLADSHIKHP